MSRIPDRIRWLPFAGGLAWLGHEFVTAGPAWDLAHGLALALTGVGWLLARGHGVTAVLIALLSLPGVWHFMWQVPSAARLLERPSGYVRVVGTVRDRTAASAPGSASASRVSLLLGEVELQTTQGRARLAELRVDLPAAGAWSFRRRSRIRIGGRLHSGDDGIGQSAHTLSLSFADAEHVLAPKPLSPWHGEALQVHLRDRAAYYLEAPALAVYLPIVLGVRERDTPEARDVAAAFRRVGVAHLFAISGLHVGLLYALFSGLLHWAFGWLRLGGPQGWPHTRGARRAAVAATIWTYVGLIGFPVPAVRAALMGTLLVWCHHWGTRTPPLYVLGLAALAILLPAPSQLYDLSFQLSFLAYAFLLQALALYQPSVGRRVEAGWPAAAARLAETVQLSLWMTLFITLGLWPVTASAFGAVSLLVFAGNLILIPLLAFIVLPLGLIAFGTSLIYAWAAPGGLPELAAFGLLEPVLLAWIRIVEVLDTGSDWWVVPLRSDWSPRGFAVYYAVLIGLISAGLWRRNRQRNPCDRIQP